MRGSFHRHHLAGLRPRGLGDHGGRELQQRHVRAPEGEAAQRGEAPTSEAEAQPELTFRDRCAVGRAGSSKILLSFLVLVTLYSLAIDESSVRPIYQSQGR